jgi:hypothetical protein
MNDMYVEIFCWILGLAACGGLIYHIWKLVGRMLYRKRLLQATTHLRTTLETFGTLVETPYPADKLEKKQDTQ